MKKDKTYLTIECKLIEEIPDKYLKYAVERLTKRGIHIYCQPLTYDILSEDVITFRITFEYKRVTDMIKKVGEICAAITSERGGTFEGEICTLEITKTKIIINSL